MSDSGLGTEQNILVFMWQRGGRTKDREGEMLIIINNE